MIKFISTMSRCKTRVLSSYIERKMDCILQNLNAIKMRSLELALQYYTDNDPNGVVSIADIFYKYLTELPAIEPAPSESIEPDEAVAFYNYFRSMGFFYYHYIDDVIEHIGKPGTSCIIQARQIGMTTFMTTYMCWLASNTKINVALIVPCNTSEIAFSMAKSLGNSVVEKYTNNTIKLYNGSRIGILNKHSCITDAQGRHFELVFIDEVAYVHDELAEQILSYFSKSAKRLVLCSQLGYKDSIFSQYCRRNTPLVLPWNVRHEESLMIEVRQRLAEDDFAHQYECQYRVSEKQESLIRPPTKTG